MPQYPTHLIGADEPERAAAVREEYRLHRERNQRNAVRQAMKRLLAVPPPLAPRNPDNDSEGSTDEPGN